MHRWVLHRAPRAEGFNLPGNLTHLRHHADPNSLQRLNVQLSESVPVCVVYYLLAWAATGSWQAATHLFTGLIAGYFFYEYLDFQAHHGTSRTRLIRYFRKYHLQHHHHDATVRYGVTSPLFDYLFGNFHLEKRRAAGGGAQAAGAGHFVKTYSANKGGKLMKIAVISTYTHPTRLARKERGIMQSSVPELIASLCPDDAEVEVYNEKETDVPLDRDWGLVFFSYLHSYYEHTKVLSTLLRRRGVKTVAGGRHAVHFEIPGRKIGPRLYLPTSSNHRTGCPRQGCWRDATLESVGE